RGRRVHQPRLRQGLHGRSGSCGSDTHGDVARAPSIRGRVVNPVSSYSFLPWLRQGVANTITSADLDTTVQTRASVHVALQLDGDPVGGGAELTASVDQDIAPYGPGDIVGIDPRAVVKTEPHPWITNFEG